MGLMMISLNLLSCSGGSKEIAKFFFDGVEEDSVNSISDTLLVDNTNGNSTAFLNTGFIETIFYHEPYKDKQCDNCHQTRGSNQLTEPQPELCYNCHDDFSEQYDVLHGPVAGGYCTGCHNPHKSKIKKLLKSKGQQLCLNCHNKKDIMLNEIHFDIEDTSCIECHNPHGGDDRFLI